MTEHFEFRLPFAYRGYIYKCPVLKFKIHYGAVSHSSSCIPGDICVVVIVGQTLEVQVEPLPARRLAGGVCCM